MQYSLREEIANAISHGVGTLLSIPALICLIVYSSLYGNAWHIVSFTIYGVSLVLLYFCSTMLHSLPEGKWKDIFEILDHSMIYVLIAGTYTPFLLVTLRGALGWSMFGIVWGLAVIGIVFKIFFVKRFMILSTILYIAMGWMIIFTFGPLRSQLSEPGIALLVSGGIIYTIGSIFYVWRKIPHHHMVWHIFVIAGSVCHFFSILFYVLPLPI